MQELKNIWSFLCRNVWPSILMAIGAIVAIIIPIANAFKVISLPLPWPVFMAIGLAIFMVAVILVLYSADKAQNRKNKATTDTSVSNSSPAQEIGNGYHTKKPKNNARWDSAQTVAWIASRDDRNIDDISRIELRGDDVSAAADEAMEILTLKQKLGLVSEAPLDDASEAIQIAARKDEIHARGRRNRQSGTEDIDPAEWVGHRLNPFVGMLLRDGDHRYRTPLWIDVTFQKQQIKKVWPPSLGSASTALIDDETKKLAGLVNAIQERALKHGLTRPSADLAHQDRIKRLRESEHPIWTDKDTNQLRRDLLQYCMIVDDDRDRNISADVTKENRGDLDKFGRELIDRLLGNN